MNGLSVIRRIIVLTPDLAPPTNTSLVGSFSAIFVSPHGPMMTCIFFEISRKYRPANQIHMNSEGRWQDFLVWRRNGDSSLKIHIVFQK
jgi:hypothetical protein